jgi:hypothetical protein
MLSSRNESSKGEDIASMRSRLAAKINHHLGTQIMDRDLGKYISEEAKQANTRNGSVAVGIAWYRADAYARCLEIFDDASDLPATFEEWLRLAKRAEEQVHRQGMKVVRAEIDPNLFPGWCATNGFSKIDKHARMAYGTVIARVSAAANS